MPVPGTNISNQKQYGDQQAIDSLIRQGSGLKQAANDAVPTPRNPVGRPPGTGTTPAPTLTPATMAATTPEIPMEHIELMKKAAIKAAISQELAAMAQDPVYGNILAEYANRMNADAESALREVKTITPDYMVD